MKKAACCYEKDKGCSNVKCPMFANYCPVPDAPGICRYESRTINQPSKRIGKWIMPFLVVVTIILCVIAFVSWVHKNNTEYEVREYSLVELNDGIYGTLTQVSSSIPAQNYEMITLCCDGNVYTFKGDVEIKYTDTNKPYVKIHDYNIVNGDDIWVYVPNGTIEFQKGIGIG